MVFCTAISFELVDFACSFHSHVFMCFLCLQPSFFKTRFAWRLKLTLTQACFGMLSSMFSTAVSYLTLPLSPTLTKSSSTLPPLLLSVGHTSRGPSFCCGCKSRAQRVCLIGQILTHDLAGTKVCSTTTARSFCKSERSKPASISIALYGHGRDLRAPSH